MLNISSRTPFSIQNPYRQRRPVTKKIIFLSLEGCVTEEEYFDLLKGIFSEIQSRIQFISVAEDAVHTAPKHRTPDQNKLLSKCRPKQLVDRIERFREEKEDIYQFSEYPEDEFWIVVDVDKNWSNEVIDSQTGTTYLDEWNEALTLCEEKNYHYAVSNPFFELWLLLHHDDPNDSDKSFAVTDTHAYEKTNHFAERLRNLNVPLKDKKHIMETDYTEEKVLKAIQRAKTLHINQTDLCPKYLATTVYMLLDEIVSVLQQSKSENLH